MLRPNALVNLTTAPNAMRLVTTFPSILDHCKLCGNSAKGQENSAMEKVVRESDGLGVRISCSPSFRERLKKCPCTSQAQPRTKLTRLKGPASPLDQTIRFCRFTTPPPRDDDHSTSFNKPLLSWESFGENEHGDLLSSIEPNPEPIADLPVLLIDMQRLTPEKNDRLNSDPEVLSCEHLNKAKHKLLVMLASEESEQVLEGLFESGTCFHSSMKEEERHRRLLRKMGVTSVDTIEYPAVATFKGERASTHLQWEYYSSLTSEFPSVNDLVSLVMGCCRTFQWKFSIIEEIQSLVRSEKLSRMERDEVDKRKVELEELAQEIVLLEPQQSDLKLVNEVLKSLQKARDEHSSVLSEMQLYQDLEAEVLSIVDQILAMTLQRSQLSTAGKEILTTHRHLRESWRADFGRLPYLQADLQRKRPLKLDSQSEEGNERGHEQCIGADSANACVETFTDWIEKLFLHLDESTALRAVVLVEEYERCLRGEDTVRCEEIEMELLSTNLVIVHKPQAHCVVKESPGVSC